MFACLMRAPRWRGWMRGSRTTSDLRPAETFSAHLTERRRGGILKPRYRKVCRLLWRSTISMSSTTGRSLLRADTTGRRTMTHRSISADLPTGESSSPSERWSAPARATDWMPRKGMKGSQITSRTETVRGRDVQALQVPAQTRVRVKGRIPTKKMTTRRAARRVKRWKSRRRDRRTSEKQCKSEETCCWWNTVAFLVI